MACQAKQAFGRLFWVGTLWGFAGISLLMFALYGLHAFAFGHVVLHGARLARFAAFWAVMFLLVGLFEEFLLRGYTQFTLARGIGFWPAALVLSCAFGLIHLRNDGEQWRGVLAAAFIGFFFCLTLRRTGQSLVCRGLSCRLGLGRNLLLLRARQRNGRSRSPAEFVTARRTLAQRRFGWPRRQRTLLPGDRGALDQLCPPVPRKQDSSTSRAALELIAEERIGNVSVWELRAAQKFRGAPVSCATPYTDFMTSEADLLTPLRRYWGYSSFRPLQERIVRSLLAGHDTCVVMPTGGGKSLCYQLPAVVSERTTVVISPLIALMQDQAAQLAQMGIPAAVLNSSVSNEEQTHVMRQARDGAFRLLYLSPERLQRADTLGWLQQVPISFFAIDEAHCISEWGHEFRPEYRQLSSLRGKFPDRPIAAFTASATRHVRHDILAQLDLRNPDKYIASFHRPNLRYLVRECDSVEHTALLVTALRHYDEGNVIVYSPTINKVEETVDFLEDQGIAAVGYHAKMDAATGGAIRSAGCRMKCACSWARLRLGWELTRRPCGRSSIWRCRNRWSSFIRRRDAPGAMEIPPTAFCFGGSRMRVCSAYFANQILDAAERDRAWQRYHTIRAFAESGKCRHRQICTHFGEIPKWTSCGGCDVCGAAPEWLREKVTTPTAAPPAQARDPSGGASSGDSQCAEADQDLREYLREWRRNTAKEQGMPAFVVLHDSSLDEICRLQPTSIAGLLEHHRDWRAQSGVIRASNSFGAAAISRRRARGGAAREEDRSRTGDFATSRRGQKLRGHCAHPRTADCDRGKCRRRTGRERPIGISCGMDRWQQTGSHRGGVREPRPGATQDLERCTASGNYLRRNPLGGGSTATRSE